MIRTLQESSTFDSNKTLACVSTTLITVMVPGIQGPECTPAGSQSTTMELSKKQVLV